MGRAKDQDVEQAKKSRGPPGFAMGSRLRSRCITGCLSVPHCFTRGRSLAWACIGGRVAAVVEVVGHLRRVAAGRV